MNLDNIFLFHEFFFTKECNIINFKQSENSVFYFDVFTHLCVFGVWALYGGAF